MGQGKDNNDEDDPGEKMRKSGKMPNCSSLMSRQVDAYSQPSLPLFTRLTFGWQTVAVECLQYGGMAITRVWDDMQETLTSCKRS